MSAVEIDLDLASMPQGVEHIGDCWGSKAGLAHALDLASMPQGVEHGAFAGYLEGVPIFPRPRLDAARR